MGGGNANAEASWGRTVEMVKAAVSSWVCTTCARKRRSLAACSMFRLACCSCNSTATCGTRLTGGVSFDGASPNMRQYLWGGEAGTSSRHSGPPPTSAPNHGRLQSSQRPVFGSLNPWCTPNSTDELRRGRTRLRTSTIARVALDRRRSRHASPDPAPPSHPLPLVRESLCDSHTPESR